MAYAVIPRNTSDKTTLADFILKFRGSFRPPCCPLRPNITGFEPELLGVKLQHLRKPHVNVLIDNAQDLV